MAKLWRRWLLWKCYVLDFAGSGSHLICSWIKRFLPLGTSLGEKKLQRYQIFGVTKEWLMKRILSIAKYSTNWHYLAVLVEIVQKKKAENNKCHSLFWKKRKKKNFHYLKKGWVSPVKCHDYTIFVYWRCENSAHSSTVQCGKPMFTYLGEKKNLKCMKCSLHMYPTSPLHVPKREIIYLSVYWFEDSKTSLKERKLGFRQE